MHRIFLQVAVFLFASTMYAGLHDSYKYLLENTIWVVPPSTLLAYSYTPDSVSSVSDQTVWVIDSYDGGFFFGKSYTGINGTQTLSQRTFLGSITNSGEVYITFYATGNTSSSDLVNGVGTFRKEQGSYRFVMQMNSGSNNNGLSHWSYMVSVTEGSPYYNDLPGVGLSVPQFLELFQ